MTSPASGLIVAHYHEVGLKGRNRRLFEDRLAANIRSALPSATVRTIPGRLIVEIDPTGMNHALEALRRVFGLSHFSPAAYSPAQMEAVVEVALSLANAGAFESFRVRCRRGNTSFPETSQRVNEVVGQAIKDATGSRVDLTHAEWTCYIEIVANKAFLYSEKLEGPGGLPAGVSGKVISLLSGGIDSPVASWELAKRGAQVELVHFHGQPYADPSSARQATRLAQHLAPWLVETKLWLVPFGDLQAEIVTVAPQELRVVLYRRFMMRIAQALAEREGAQALVTGDSLGQVASQTLPNLAAIEAVVESMPVLRPLIGRDKIEIEAIARRIGTYEISIQPHQDCCVLFVPRKVTTRAWIPQLLEVEHRLEVEILVEKALSNASLGWERTHPRRISGSDVEVL